ncbi:DNA polymerase III beta subunit [hydrothermal vent metagenome]|uniref:DNA polymerase III beta subunit n=1 Tax=hydrothermal vent metagenome TaxID=652676 RepID=A0A3B0RWY3_9ZZZZ
MKFSIERAHLLKALSHVTSVVERRNTIPILSNVLLSATADGVSFAATDLDIEIIETTEAQVQKEGVATLPAHTFYEIARKLPDGADVNIERTGEDSQITLTAGRAKFALPTLPEDEFPALSAEGMTHQFQMQAAEFARLIDKTRFAVSSEETRYYLNGVHLHATDDKDAVIRAVATDGHQLALCESPAPDGATGMPAIIIPRKTIGEVRKLIDDVSGDIDIQVSDAKIRFSVGSAILTSKLIDGSFPDYQRVIPKDNENRLELENRSFAASVDRVATVSTEKSRSVKMILEADALTLRVSNPEAGQGTEEVSVSYGGEPMEIGFNAKYLLNVLSQIDGQDVVFCLSNANSPILIEDSGDEHALYVLMPLRV